MARGAYIARAANCAGCHTAPDGPAFAGGRALATPFGTFYGPNITPDPDTGLGGWSEDDLKRALRLGRAPDGHAYYPSFPYTSFTGMSDDDIRALKAWLDTLPPVRRANRPHDLGIPLDMRWALPLWQVLYLTPGPFRPVDGRDPQWTRGAYLVSALGHCGECHTPRNVFGARLEARALAGTAQGAGLRPVPNITPDDTTGLGRWSISDIAWYLETGIRPDGDVAGGAMAEVIRTSTSHLTAADRRAIAVYLKSLPPTENRVAQ